MPQADKTDPKSSAGGYTSPEGTRLKTDTRPALAEALRLAADYRGDVTLRRADGSTVEGFIYNYDLNTDSVELFVKESARASEVGSVPATSIQEIHFSGEDTAFGKSWDDWTAKSEKQRKAEARRIEEEIARKGLL
mgnify:CR=1 FL=1